MAMSAVSVSVCHKLVLCFVETSGWIELVFGVEASVNPMLR